MKMFGLAKKFCNIFPDVIIKRSQIFRQFYTRFERSILKSKQDLKNPKEFKLSEFKEIYRYPQIKFFAGISKIKPLGVIVSILALPPVLIFNYENKLSNSAVIFFFCTVAAILLVLLIISHLSRNLVGVIYVSKNDKTKVVVSYLGKRSRRINSVVISNDLTISDYNNFLAKSSFKKLTVKNSEQELKLNVSMKNVRDFGAFIKVFPNLF